MNEKYEKIIDCVIESGKRIKSKAGLLDDIGVTKKYLTEEDLRIERDLKKIVETFGADHKVFAEEENDKYPDVKNVWAIDSISGTSTFLAGLPHYAIVVSHLINGEVSFAAVYDPAMDELYTAELDKGAFCNGKKICVSNNNDVKIRVVANISHRAVKEEKILEKLIDMGVNMYRNRNSFAINYCEVAAGKYDGVVVRCKDTFPELAGSLIINEAGGKFTNKNGHVICPEDRHFVGGNTKAYDLLKDFFRS